MPMVAFFQLNTAKSYKIDICSNILGEIVSNMAFGELFCGGRVLSNSSNNNDLACHEQVADKEDASKHRSKIFVTVVEFGEISFY